MVRPLSVVGVIGLGTVGSALTALLSRAGVRVMAVEADRVALQDGYNRVRRHVEELAENPGVTPGRIDYAVRPELLPSNVDIVVEAVSERVELKADVLHRVHTFCTEETVFVTTTTGLPVTEIAARSGRMTRTVGLHWGEPGPARPVLELVRTPVTDESAIADVVELVRLLGGTTVATADRPGFAGGALILGLLNSAATMCDDGYASSADIDDAMVLGCGLPRGPLAQLDLMGVDTVYDSLRAMYHRTGDRTFVPAPILERMVVAGLLGRKTGRGFHIYPAAEAQDESPAPEGRPVRHIGIIGTGTMASGIAEVCARAGYTTTVVGRTELRAKEALTAVEVSLDRRVRRGKAKSEDLTAAMDRLTATAELDSIAECDLVLEAVAEDLDVKRAVFAKLDQVARPGAVLATTTSSLPVLACATATGRPEDVVGIHFFNPAPAMRLVEVAHTLLTAPDVTATAHAIGAALGKRTIHCGDRTGFIVNALLLPYLNHAVRLLRDNVAGVDDIDSVMTGGYGMPVGPFALLDMIGLDVSLAIQQRMHEISADSRLAPAAPLVDLVNAGYLGRKTARGFRSHP